MKNKGFSLVELIVVIAIMAILVGVAVPVYTNYIDKANAAKDEQLLGEINNAFAIVCAGEALDINTVTNATIAVDDDGAIDLAGMKVYTASGEVAGIAAKMVEVLGEGLKFNTIETISYNKTTHKFVAGELLAFQYGGGTIYLSPADIEALKNSTFATEMTVEELLNKVSDVTGYAALMSGSSALNKIFNSDEFKASAAAALKIDPSELGNTAVELAQKMVDEGLAPDFSTAIAQVNANAAVLFAAQNATKMTPADITALLSNDGASSKITGKLNSDPGTALSQAALAYGMYTAYAYSTGDQALIDATEDPALVLSGLDDDDFQAYMTSEQGQKDLEGYLSSLNMINSSTGDKTAVEHLMVNGFNDSELVALLNQSMGN